MKIEQYDYAEDHWSEIFENSREDLVYKEYESLIKASQVPLRIVDDSTVLRLFHMGSGYYKRERKNDYL
jgi:hypothetical protein